MKSIYFIALLSSCLLGDTMYEPQRKCIQDDYFIDNSNGRIYYKFSHESTWRSSTNVSTTNLQGGWSYEVDTNRCYPPLDDKEKITDFNTLYYKSDLVYVLSSLLGFLAILWVVRKSISIIKRS